MNDRSFCFLPWINLETFQEGILRLCCYTNSWNDDCSPRDRYDPAANRIERMLNSEFFRNTRLHMLNGEYPKPCRRCYEEEKAAIRSPRQYLPEEVTFTYTFEDAVRDTRRDGSIDADVRAMTLRFGNTCNLACRICQPYNSSRWEKEFLTMDKEFLKYRADGEHPAWKFMDSRKNVFADVTFWDNLTACGGSMAQIHFAGGEPLIMNKQWEFLEYLIEQGRSGNIALSYSTNCAEIPEKAFAVWGKFKSVHLYLSIDDLGKRLEYQRHGLKWDKVLANIDRLRDKNIHYQLMPTISWLNVFYLDEFIRYFSGTRIIYNYLYLPPFLAARILPEDIKRDVVARCEPLLPVTECNNLKMQMLKSPADIELLSMGMRFNAWLDQNRNESFKDTFPEYYEKLSTVVDPAAVSRAAGTGARADSGDSSDGSLEQSTRI